TCPASLFRSADGAGGLLVVVAARGGDAAARRRLRHGTARAVGLPAAVDRRPLRQAELREGPLARLAPPPTGGVAVVAAEVQQLAVPQLGEPGDHLRHAVRFRERADAAQLP